MMHAASTASIRVKRLPVGLLAPAALLAVAACGATVPDGAEPEAHLEADAGARATTPGAPGTVGGAGSAGASGGAGGVGLRADAAMGIVTPGGADAAAGANADRRAPSAGSTPARDGGVAPPALPPAPPPPPPALATTLNPCVSPALGGAELSGVNVARGKYFAAASTSYGSAAAAVDGDLKTSSDSPTNKDGILAVDLGAPAALFRVVVTFQGVTPQRYKLQGSQDGARFTDILRVANPTFVDERVLPRVTFRYVRLVVYQNSARGEEPNALPAIAELELYTRADMGTDCAPISYPVPLDRKAWKATSSAGNAQGAISSPQQGWIDPSGTFSGPDHWLVKAGASVGSWIRIDMGSAQTFNQIFLDFDHDPLRDLRVFVSDDGTTWGDPIFSGTVIPLGAYVYAPLTFARQTKRYVKIESLFDTKGRYWGFWNISALDAPVGGDPIDAVNVALNRPTAGSNSKDPASVFDGNDTTGIDDGHVLAVDLGSEVPIGRIDVKFGRIIDGFGYRIATSSDGNKWVDQQHVLLGYVFNKTVTNPVQANYRARFLRFTFQPSHPNNTYIKQNLREIEVYRGPAMQVVGRARTGS